MLTCEIEREVETIAYASSASEKGKQADAAKRVKVNKTAPAADESAGKGSKEQQAMAEKQRIMQPRVVPGDSSSSSDMDQLHHRPSHLASSLSASTPSWFMLFGGLGLLFVLWRAFCTTRRGGGKKLGGSGFERAFCAGNAEDVEKLL